MAEIIKCPSCASEVSNDNEICLICGAKLNSVKSFWEREPTLECLDVRPLDHFVKPPALHSKNVSAAKRETNSGPESTHEHYTAAGLSLIIFMAVIGIIVGLFVGFHGGIAVGTVVGDSLNLVFSRDLYREASLVSGYYFFATMLAICFYTGGSFGKSIYLSKKLSDQDYKAMYSNYGDRLIRTWVYTLIGIMINIILFLIIDITLLNPPACNPDLGYVLIVLGHVLIAGFTIFSIQLAKEHSA